MTKCSIGYIWELAARKYFIKKLVKTKEKTKDSPSADHLFFCSGNVELVFFFGHRSSCIRSAVSFYLSCSYCFCICKFQQAVAIND